MKGITATPQRRKIVVLTHFFAPGYKGGGPIQSVGNIVRLLGEEFDFYVITMDRDLGSSLPYDGIRVNQWQSHGKSSVFYVKKSCHWWWTVISILIKGDFDLLYINSYFNHGFSIFPLAVRRLGRLFGFMSTPCLLAPRGEFSVGALAIHPMRKRFYIRLSKVFGFYNEVTWHASSNYEANDILRVTGAGSVKIGTPLGDQNRIFTALDLVGSNGSARQDYLPSIVREKCAGEAVVGFVSRISPMKNLEFALEVLAGVTGKVQFDIYGPAEDRDYWGICQRAIALLPPNVTVRWHGELPHKDVAGVLRSLHLLFLPTRGENFGHIICEALSVGCPVLISNRTPWRGLAEAGAGWDLPLDDVASFRAALTQVVAMSDGGFLAFSEAAARFAQSHLRASGAVEQNRRMFNECLHPPVLPNRCNH
jgi:glycosyltransferase involved in cell wall biosynthesis